MIAAIPRLQRQLEGLGGGGGVMADPNRASGDKISKMEAARRQLQAAVGLFFDEGDDVAVHTLVAAARQVLVDLLKRQGKTLRLEEHLKKQYTPEGQSRWHKARAQAENFFKHAQRDPAAGLEFNPAQTHFLLLDCVEAYSVLARRSLHELRAFTAWFLLEYPDYITPGPLKDIMCALPEELRGAHRDRRAFMAAFTRHPPAAFADEDRA